ncbi:acyl-CoA/acyl-ACP dehydrogenase [Pseudomonas sp. 39004]|jgi:alkylation response protein AidB-like acyl-CoA dehydrogenase|uniref:acyl-CoA dehydrogenase family protein n=1 Tax=unclassified Pseudomonas TaxID=196821 RepID=UPI0023637A6D|nr:acyl-CoA dehydrogenase family protein [Pseudomonas sp. 39004]MDD1962300.1 acyl-CoA/acyl-ACP dehydrogenase [Pseudomonas sp. 39004]
MDFELNEDQRAIAEMAGSLMSDYCTDECLRDWDLSGQPYMQALWASCVETGLHALAIPEAAGGSGLGMTELIQVLDAQGGALAQVPLWRHQLAAATLAEFGGAALAPWVAQAATASSLLSLTLDGLSNVRGIELLATADGPDWQLSGRVAALPLAEQSAAALVPARVLGQPRLVLLDLAQAGICKVPGVMTHGEAHAELHLQGVRINASQVLPEAALGWLAPRAIAALAALQLGVSAEQVHRTVAYISERQQFDRAIGSFQAVQMSMADTHVQLEVLRSALWQLCYRLDAGLPAPSEALATAYLACEAGHRIGHTAQHVHGGIGVDLTYPIHRFLYWSRALSSALGGSSAILEQLGDWLNENDTLGWKYDLEEHQAL